MGIFHLNTFTALLRIRLGRGSVSRLGYSIQVENATLVTNIGPVTIVEDGVRPIVTIDSPENGSRIFLGDDLVMNVTTTDNVGIASIEFIVDGQGITPTTSPVRLQRLLLPQWRINGLSAGPHTIVARARDLSGFVTASTPLTIQIWRGAISREFSVFNVGSAQSSGATSREYSVFNFGEPTVSGAISREYSVFNFGSELRSGAISREHSVENKPTQ